VMRSPEDHNIMQMQEYISMFTDKIQEMTLFRVVRPEVLCTGFYIEGHITTECPIFMGLGPPTHPMAPPAVGPLGGVVQVVVAVPFHHPVQYHAFPNHQGDHSNEYCEIYRSHGNSPRHCPILQKHTYVLNTIYCELCGSPTHTTNQGRALDDLANRLDRSTFKVN
jgi:hypothetical protein